MNQERDMESRAGPDVDKEWALSFRINTNVDALRSVNHLGRSSTAISKSLTRLSSGLRINGAADDAAGLSISERMRGQIRGLAQADRNIGDAVSLVQTAEGALSQVHGMLQRVRELAVQSKNGSLSTADRGAIGSEVSQLHAEIVRIGESTKFNGIGLLDNNRTIAFQIGPNDGDTITITNATLNASGFLTAGYDVLGGAADLAEIDSAIDNVSRQRAIYGATQNRLGFAASAQKTHHASLVAAESRIRDVDMASELVNLTRHQILAQVGIAMLAQANQQPRSILSLLR